MRDRYLTKYIDARKDPIALDILRDLIWEDFIGHWPEFNNPPFQEEVDMVARYQTSKARVRRLVPL